MRNWTKALGLALLFSVASVSAQEEAKVAVKSKFEDLLQMSVSSIANSPVDGVLQVMTDKGLFYVSEDAKYLLHGRIYNLDQEMRNETEEALSGMRKSGLPQFADDVIEFKAKDEKYAITIFTDITCGYCRKLHKEIEDYNAKGITVRYLAYPRGGLGSKSYDDLVSIWCAEDPQAAMTNGKSGGNVAPKTCANSVAEQFQFAQSVGISSTPAVIFDNGLLQPGYRPAADMAKVLAEM
ncbi:thioredoxin fold domain-containing protein [Planctobacterium marinum]|uniref:thioredoxin fold domain-containing protein n=1 Tax=Planctobacterium marinum TaxID=1631968 RepID=UPI001E29417D|nr:thioredoxin fold domain-containing protein [Planctobacterium marinum]MCC2605246.1 thioredoxin fold domain-containing protein [Planctobacterium marinum]